MSLPVVAICGRPNVGKSTLFNALVGRRVSIVEPTSGVTRDRIEHLVEIEERFFKLIDTGGIGVVDEQQLDDQIHEQIYVAINQADLVLLLVDVKSGLAPLDSEISALLRKKAKKILLVANKTDVPELTVESQQFYKLGIGEPLCISAQQNIGLEDLRDVIFKHISKIPPAQMPKEADLKIAVVGKPNSGKSTIINALANEERVIVSELPGTTRDSIDVRFEKDERSIIAIDTAGLKRSKNVNNSIEFYSQKRAERAIRRCDIALLVIDATQKINKIDKNIANYIREQFKPVIIVINKWDLVPKHIGVEKYEEYISKTINALPYAPISFTTAITGKKIPATIDLARNLFKRAHRRITTGELNKIITEVVAKKSPPSTQNRKAKIYYGTQAGVNPPTIVLFVNDVKLINSGYQRYLFNSFQELLAFDEIPVRIVLKERERRGAEIG